jgi:hypothetical protein
MNNKEFKGMVAALEKVAGEQKKVTGALLEKLEIVTDNLIEIIKNHDLNDNLKMFDFKNYGFRLKGSSHGKWIHFCKLEEYGSKILPTKTSDINSSFYYHNDFNYLTEYMTRNDVLTLCEVLPEFIQNMISKIQSLTDKEQEFLNKFVNVE